VLDFVVFLKTRRASTKFGKQDASAFVALARSMKGLLVATNHMTKKSFVDSNVVLYTIGKDARKAEIARRLVEARPTVSPQV